MEESRNVDVSIVYAVELTNHVGVGVRKHGLLQVGVLLLGHTEKSLPLIIRLSFLLLYSLWILQHQVDFVRIFFLQRSFESLRIDFLQDRLQSVERFLQNLVPVGISHVNYDRHEQRESVALVSLEDVQEVIVFKEAHCSISDLQM